MYRQSQSYHRHRISVDEKQKSQAFMKTINNVMEIVDFISEKLCDSEYLELCNLVKELYDINVDRDNLVQSIRAQFRDNEVVRQHERRTHMCSTEMFDEQEVEDADNPNKVLCEKCNKFISKSYYDQHQTNTSCNRVYDAKKLTLTTNKLNTTQHQLAILRIRKLRNRQS